MMEQQLDVTHLYQLALDIPIKIFFTEIKIEGKKSKYLCDADNCGRPRPIGEGSLLRHFDKWHHENGITFRNFDAALQTRFNVLRIRLFLDPFRKQGNLILPREAIPRDVEATAWEAFRILTTTVPEYRAVTPEPNLPRYLHNYEPVREAQFQEPGLADADAGGGFGGEQAVLGGNAAACEEAGGEGEAIGGGEEGEGEEFYDCDELGEDGERGGEGELAREGEFGGDLRAGNDGGRHEVAVDEDGVGDRVEPAAELDDTDIVGGDAENERDRASMEGYGANTDRQLEGLQFRINILTGAFLVLCVAVGILYAMMLSGDMCHPKS